MGPGLLTFTSTPPMIPDTLPRSVWPITLDDIAAARDRIRPFVPVSPFRGYRFPPEIITHAVWLYHRFSLSHRDVEELLAERGVPVSYEAIRL